MFGFIHADFSALYVIYLTSLYFICKYCYTFAYEINHTLSHMDIKGIIKKRGYTIESVAKEMGITRVTLSQNLASNKTPSLTTLQRIAKVIGCSVGEFFWDEVKPSRFTALVRNGSDTFAFDELEELRNWVNNQVKKS